MNRHRQAMNVSVVKSDTGSKYTTLTDTDTNTETITVSLRTTPYWR